MTMIFEKDQSIRKRGSLLVKINTLFLMEYEAYSLPWKVKLYLLYSHNDINSNNNNNNNNNTNTGGTNGFISFYLQSLETRKETQIIKAYTNDTLLTPTHTHTRRILRCLRSQHISASQDPN